MNDHDLLIRIDERLQHMEGMLIDSIATDKSHDSRIKRIELCFVPILAGMSIAFHKFLNWAGW